MVRYGVSQGPLRSVTAPYGSLRSVTVFLRVRYGPLHGIPRFSQNVLLKHGKAIFRVLVFPRFSISYVRFTKTRKFRDYVLSALSAF